MHFSTMHWPTSLATPISLFTELVQDAQAAVASEPITGTHMAATAVKQEFKGTAASSVTQGTQAAGKGHVRGRSIREASPSMLKSAAVNAPTRPPEAVVSTQVAAVAKDSAAAVSPVEDAPARIVAPNASVSYASDDDDDDVDDSDINGGAAAGSSRCQECIRTHEKCSRLDPCSSCIKRGIVCVYDRPAIMRSPSTMRSPATVTSPSTGARCEACKRAHRRCSGNAPCSFCIERGFDCLLAMKRDSATDDITVPASSATDAALTFALGAAINEFDVSTSYSVSAVITNLRAVGTNSLLAVLRDGRGGSYKRKGRASIEGPLDKSDAVPVLDVDAAKFGRALLAYVARKTIPPPVLTWETVEALSTLPPVPAFGTLPLHLFKGGAAGLVGMLDWDACDALVASQQFKLAEPGALSAEPAPSLSLAGTKRGRHSAASIIDESDNDDVDTVSLVTFNKSMPSQSQGQVCTCILDYDILLQTVVEASYHVPSHSSLSYRLSLRKSARCFPRKAVRLS
jgi:hypothetical protein